MERVSAALPSSPAEHPLFDQGGQAGAATARSHVAAAPCTKLLPEGFVVQQQLQALAQLGGIAAGHHRAAEQPALAAREASLELGALTGQGQRRGVVGAS